MRTLICPHDVWKCVGIYIANIVLIVLIAGTILAGTDARANPKYAGVVIDVKTGKTLYSRNADKHRYPASLTKMMTLYMMFDALKQGRMTKKTPIKMSRYAASNAAIEVGYTRR